jgi:Short-chain dehydrogenases of various substrate specificities
MNLDGKRIVLTGASSGIGKEILNKLQNYDVNVIAVGRNISKIPITNDRIIPFSCDVSKKEEVDKLFDFALTKLGGIDIFIANAGYAFCEYINEANWDHINEIFSTNVFSPIYSVEKMRVLNRNKKYSVVITCSAVSEIPLPGYSLYCATKHAINGFGRVYRYEVKENEIISLVYPVATNTSFFKTAADRAPVPWPLQEPEKVARSIIKGIEKEKRFIYPAKSFIFLKVLGGIFPFITSIYVNIHKKKFDKWAQNQ